MPTTPENIHIIRFPNSKFLEIEITTTSTARTPKPIAMNVVDKTDVVVEEPILIEQPAPVVEPEKEAAPPVELNVSKGDW